MADFAAQLEIPRGAENCGPWSFYVLMIVSESKASELKQDENWKCWHLVLLMSECYWKNRIHVEGCMTSLKRIRYCTVYRCQW